MRDINDWLTEYGSSHRNPTNKLLHWICVPPIVLTVLGFISLVPVPAGLAATWPGFSWVFPAVLLALVYYWLLSPSLALGMIPVFLGLLWLLAALASLPWPLWATCLTVFVIAWIGQFIGHMIEGARPSFFKDLQFLLIGPLWLLAFAYRSLNLRYAKT